MRNQWYLVIMILATAVFAECCRGETDCIVEKTNGANPWTHLKFQDDAKEFQFVIVSDRTGGHRPGVFAKAMRKVNLLQPEFVISIGDLIEGYTNDKERIKSEWEEFDNIVKQLEMPFFYVAGNHDISGPEMLEIWRERRGQPYYHFVYKDVLFLCLDSEGGAKEFKKNHLDKDQQEYFREVLEKYHKVRWTLVFVHRPMWEKNRPSWLEIEKLLGERKYTVFAGHIHLYAKNVRQGRSYIRLGTTGGAIKVGDVSVGRTESICLGRFDHIVWVTMTEKGPRLANLTLDGIFSEDVTNILLADAVMEVKKKIDQGKAIVCTPIKIKGEKLVNGKTQIKITNFAFVPMRVEGGFRGHPQLTVNPNTIKEYLLPYASRIIDVEVKAAEPVKVEEISPLVLDSTIIFKAPFYEPVKCKVTNRIIIEMSR